MGQLYNRMKRYEAVSEITLMCNTPVIMRLDGRSFRTFTKGVQKPFDDYVRQAMELTMLDMCKETGCCLFGYTQSDEISLLLYDKGADTEAWFGNNVQKLCSICAGLSSVSFNRHFREIVTNGWETLTEEQQLTYSKKFDKAVFDCRVFNIPQHEITNYFICRQQDAIRNSVQSLAQKYYNQSELEKCGRQKQLEMIKAKGDDWESYALMYRHGIACIKVPTVINGGTPFEATRKKWVFEHDLPIFTEDAKYVNKAVYSDEN